ncbi:hypothetical protein [Legionella sp. WA2024007413]
MAFEKLLIELENFILVDMFNVMNDSNCLPTGYTFEIDLSVELISSISLSEKKDLFNKIFDRIEEYMKSVQNDDIPLNISALSILKDLIKDNPINTKKLFLYLTDSSRIDYIITAENLPTLRELFPEYASLQKQSLPEIKTSVLAAARAFEKLLADLEDNILIDVINVMDDLDVSIGYAFEMNLSAELVSSITPSEKKELFDKIFDRIKGTIASVQNWDITVNITALRALKDLVKDNPTSTKKLFFYLTDSSRIDYIVTTENLPTLRELFPGNASLQKQSLTEIKDSILADQQFYGKASVRGFFFHKKELPYEMAEKIGSYLDIKTATTVAKTVKNAAQLAKDAIEAVDDDNGLLKKFI